MLRRFLCTLAAAALALVGVTPQAQAYFEEGTIVRTLYQRGTGTDLEIGSDLGFSGLTLQENAPQGQSLPGYPVGVVGDLLTVGHLYDVRSSIWLAYWGGDKLTTLTGHYWAGSTDPVSMTMAANRAAAIDDSIDVLNYYRGLSQSQGNASTVQASRSNLKSYYYLMDKNGTSFGSFAGALKLGSTDMEISLAELYNDPDKTIQMTLYYFYYTNSETNGWKHLNLTLETFLLAGADGQWGTADDQLGTRVVPIPGSILLLGSGLLALIGIRRRRLA